MAYIEDRIDCLEDRVCKLERQLENQHLKDRVSTLEDIVENDGHKLDELAESFKKLEEEVKDIKSGIKLNNADIFSRLQHISDRVYGVPKTGSTYKIADGDEPQVQQTTEEFVKVVRCKDCKYANIIYRTCENPYAVNKDVRIVESDYCSRGEKI